MSARSIAIASLYLLNFAGIIWVISLPRDEAIDRTLLSEVGSATDAGSGVLREEFAALANQEPGQKSLTELLHAKSDDDALQRANSRMLVLAYRYVQRYDRYRAATYFLFAIVVLDCVFIYKSVQTTASHRT